MQREGGRGQAVEGPVTAIGDGALAAHVDDVLNVVLHSEKREEPSKLVPTEATGSAAATPEMRPSRNR